MFPSIISCIVPIQRRTLPRRCKAVGSGYQTWLFVVALVVSCFFSAFSCFLLFSFSVFEWFCCCCSPLFVSYAGLIFGLPLTKKKKKKILSWLWVVTCFCCKGSVTKLANMSFWCCIYILFLIIFSFIIEGKPSPLTKLSYLL